MTVDFPAYTPRRDSKWSEIQYRQLPFRDDRLDSYREALDSVYLNGRSDFGAFEATNRDDFLSAYQFDHRGVRVPIEEFLAREPVLQLFSQGGLTYGSPKDVSIFDQGDCQFEGLLADILLGGGAYGRWKRSVAEAKALAADFVSAIRSLAPERPWSPFHVRGPWCCYFYDIAWDHTLLVQFPYDARWFIFCATDTD
jgi:hypothetical protein